MVATQHTQSLSDFRQKAGKILERLNKSGEAEILTVNGEARAVLLAPSVYDELTREARLTRDVLLVRQAMKEIDDGKGMKVDLAFKKLRAELLQLKSKRSRTKKAK